MPTSYKTDVVAWSNEQAAFIRAGRFDQLDLENIAEEILDVGKSEKRELFSRLSVLIMHLLKWKFQPEKRGSSWLRTIKAQRKEIAYGLKETPSLKPQLQDIDWIDVVWNKAVVLTEAETSLPDNTFPETCPWSITEVLQENWLPADLH